MSADVSRDNGADIPGRGTAVPVPSESNETAPYGVDHRLETVVRPELLVDVMQMVAKRLGRNAERSRYLPRRASRSEQMKDPLLLLGERRYRQMNANA